MRRLAIALALATAATGALTAPALSAPPSSSTPPPPTLAGEQLLGGGTGDQGSLDQSCSAPVTFSADGVATGPYPGPYTETVTIDPNAGTFVANFRIVSGTTIITGTKTQGVQGPDGTPMCETSVLQSDEIFVNYFGDMAYVATIQTTDGIYHDEGTGTAGLFFNDAQDVSNTLANEEFLDSSFDAPVLIERCKPGNGKNAKDGCHSGAPGQTKKG